MSQACYSNNNVRSVLDSKLTQPIEQNSALLGQFIQLTCMTFVVMLTIAPVPFLQLWPIPANVCRFVVLNLPDLGGLPNLSPPYTAESMSATAKVSKAATQWAGVVVWVLLFDLHNFITDSVSCNAKVVMNVPVYTAYIIFCGTYP